MPRKTFRVGELGVGDRAKKLVDLALRHPWVEFIGVDKFAGAHYGRYLREIGQSSKPANLNVKRKTDAVAFLQSQPDNSFSHLYSHFMMQHIGFDVRQSLYHQLKRTLKPGARFIVVEEIFMARQLLDEFRQQGFAVSMKRLSPEQLFLLGSESAMRNARGIKEIDETIKSRSELYPLEFTRRTGIKSTSDERQNLLAKAKDRMRRKMERLPGNDSPKARVALRRILLHLSEMLSKKPFAVITARKPKNRPIRL